MVLEDGAVFCVYYVCICEEIILGITEAPGFDFVRFVGEGN